MSPKYSISLIFSASLFVCTSAIADPAVIPAEQSKCEIESHKYWTAHIKDKPDFRNFKWPDYEAVFSLEAPPPKPVDGFRDKESGVTFSVENDGRHVSAVDAAGNLLWRRNPFVDSSMCPYRSPHPYIVWIGPPEAGNGPGWHLDSPSTARPDAMTNERIFSELSRIVNAHWRVKPPMKGDHFFGLAFNSSQMGYVNIRNGDFYMMGQN